jgi:Acyl-CoA reductase (LuxC)
MTPPPRLDFLPRSVAPEGPRAVRSWKGIDWESGPPLTAARISGIAGALVRNAEAQRPGLKTARLVATLGAVAEAWCDREDPYRVAAERWLPAVTGYAPGMVAAALDRLFRSLRADRLEKLLKSEVGHLRAPGPRLLAVIASGTVFPPAIVGATSALLLRSPVIVKTASAEPVLAPLWARSLEARDPELGSLVAVLGWPRTDTALTQALLDAADRVLGYGDDETMAAIRAAMPPGAHLVAHGHKVSAAILSARALETDAPGLARRLAREVALYDQQGCLSPHTVFVVASAAKAAGAATAAPAFAELLAAELAALAHRWPPAPLDPPQASSLRQVIGARELASQPPMSAVLGGVEHGYAVVLDPSASFEVSPLGRTVFVKPVADVEEAIAALAPVRQQLQAVGLAVSHAERRALARGLGILDDLEADLDWVPRIRLCPVGAMQDPPVTWAADGHRPLAALCPLGS